MANSEHPRAFEFSGLESDQFVRLTQRLLSQHTATRVEVHGREPITSTPAKIVGKPIGAVNDGYSRILQVEDANGMHYNIGGTNTTKSIASERVRLIDVPHTVVPHVASDATLDRWLAALHSTGATETTTAITALEFGLRSKALSADTHGLIGDGLLPFVSSPNVSVRVAAIGLVGLLGTARVLPILTAALNDESASVRRQGALRLRGMDTIVAENRDDPAALGCIAALVAVLGSDTDEYARIYAAEDLGYFYDNAAVDALRIAVETDASIDVRWASTVAIGRSNAVAAVSILHSVLSRESDPSIRRAALLGIGRHARDLALREPNVASEIAESLAHFVAESSIEGIDYAIHALGEFGETAARYFDIFVESISSDAIQIRAPAVLGIARLIPYVDSDTWRATVLQLLRQSMHASEPADWPDIGFYRWFLSAGGDLALALEDFALADEIFGVASRASGQADWLQRYYQGASLYARAEESIVNRDPAGMARAIDCLRQAVDCFATVEDSEVFSDADAGRSGLRLKRILVEARLATLSALSAWPSSLLSQADYETVRAHLSRARDLYRRLDLTNLSPTERKLSAQEVALISCLQLVVDALDEACHLGERLLNHDAAAVGFSVGTLGAQCARLAKRVEETHSLSLRKVAQELAEGQQHIDAVASSDVERATALLDLLPTVLLGPAPAPGSCPIVTFGEATLTVEAGDVVSGSGTRADPFIVLARNRVVFAGTVYVHHRSKEDELIFTAHCGTANDQNVTQYVPVHEGSYALRPVQLAPLAPSTVATPFEFELSFRNRGCLQPVAMVELWLKVIDAAFDPSKKAGHGADLATTEAAIEDRTARLAECVAASERGADTTAIARRRRQLERELVTLQAWVDELHRHQESQA